MIDVVEVAIFFFFSMMAYLVLLGNIASYRLFFVFLKVVHGQEGLPRTVCRISSEAKDRNAVGVKRQERKER